MIPNAIIIGTARHSSSEAAPSRRSPGLAASFNARQPIPRRIPNEFYPTPPAAVRALLAVEHFEGSIWEPACGEGAITRELIAGGHDVVSTDLHSYGFGDTGVDFLKEGKPRARHIVTNPPYGSGLADAFMLKARKPSRGIVTAGQSGAPSMMAPRVSAGCRPRTIDSAGNFAACMLLSYT